jgi:hypothetical protein
MVLNLKFLLRIEKKHWGCNKKLLSASRASWPDDKDHWDEEKDRISLEQK